MQMIPYVNEAYQENKCVRGLSSWHDTWAGRRVTSSMCPGKHRHRLTSRASCDTCASLLRLLVGELVSDGV
jgi:hypothetical protein